LPDTSVIIVDTINDEPFSYRIVPFIDFKNVSINHVKMNFCSLKDTSYINIPSLKAVNFTFNDSIAADSLVQYGGDYFFLRIQFQRMSLQDLEYRILFLNIE